jgi:IS30 family transposase
MVGAMSGGTHLELEERERLAALKAEGLSSRAIARRLGRAASTVSRELRRDALPKGGYLPAGVRRGLLPGAPPTAGRPRA